MKDIRTPNTYYETPEEKEQSLEKLKSKHIYIDVDVECPDLEGVFDINPYSSDTPDAVCPD